MTTLGASMISTAQADQLTAGDLDAIAAIVATHHKITTARERLLRLLRNEADARRTTTESDAPQSVAGSGCAEQPFPAHLPTPDLERPVQGEITEGEPT